MQFDGEAVSLTPSVGNWEYPCQAHYWIKKNKIKWAPQWSKERIEEGRRQDQDDLDEYFSDRSEEPSSETEHVDHRVSVRQRIRNVFVR